MGQIHAQAGEEKIGHMQEKLLLLLEAQHVVGQRLKPLADADGPRLSRQLVADHGAADALHGIAVVGPAQAHQHAALRRARIEAVKKGQKFLGGVGVEQAARKNRLRHVFDPVEAQAVFFSHALRHAQAPAGKVDLDGGKLAHREHAFELPPLGVELLLGGFELRHVGNDAKQRGRCAGGDRNGHGVQMVPFDLV